MITKRLFSIFVGAVLFLLAVLTIKGAYATRTLANNNAEALRLAAMAKASNVKADVARGNTAYSARWGAMAGNFTVKGAPIAPASANAVVSQRSLAADAARWTAMGKASNAVAIAHSNAAYSTRWGAMASYYAAKSAPVVAAATVDTVAVTPRSVAADAARWTAKANYWANK